MRASSPPLSEPHVRGRYGWGGGRWALLTSSSALRCLRDVRVFPAATDSLPSSLRPAACSWGPGWARPRGWAATLVCSLRLPSPCVQAG